jgi:ubiquinone/menaquinone biosynthesis C-methylase UbiE
MAATKVETTPEVPELKTLKAKLKATWMAGDFGRIAQTFPAGAEEFVARLGLKPGQRVLDVACGTGNQSLPAARTGATVTGLDLAANLIEQARANANAAGLQIQFDEGDAEQLPYADASFDVVLSMFGAMFAPRPELVAAELLRVCRPGGRITMGNWTPAGFIGQMFKTTSRHVPPPNMPSPLLWGDEETVRQRFGKGVAEVKFERRSLTFQEPLSPAQMVELFRTYYGPTLRAFASLNDAGQEALRRDLEELWTSHNRATDGTTDVESEYLEVIAVRG